MSFVVVVSLVPSFHYLMVVDSPDRSAWRRCNGHRAVVRRRRGAASAAGGPSPGGRALPVGSRNENETEIGLCLSLLWRKWKSGENYEVLSLTALTS